jgi:hypothetical protein
MMRFHDEITNICPIEAQPNLSVRTISKQDGQ